MKTLMPNGQQFVTDAKGKPVGVLLDLGTYERLREAAEDLADIRDYEAARPKVLAELSAGQYSLLADYQTKGATAK